MNSNSDSAAEKGGEAVGQQVTSQHQLEDQHKAGAASTIMSKTEVSAASGSHILACTSSGFRKKENRQHMFSPPASRLHRWCRGLTSHSQQQSHPSASKAPGSCLELGVAPTPAWACTAAASRPVSACTGVSGHRQFLKVLFSFGGDFTLHLFRKIDLELCCPRAGMNRPAHVSSLGFK